MYTEVEGKVEDLEIFLKVRNIESTLLLFAFSVSRFRYKRTLSNQNRHGAVPLKYIQHAYILKATIFFITLTMKYTVGYNIKPAN